MLNLNQLSLSLSDKTILKNISVEVNDGELVVILGPNGAGKSSLLKVVSGELKYDSGEINFRSQPLDAWPLQEKSRQCAVLAQQSLLNFPFTVFEVVSLGRTPHSTGAAADKKIVDEALSLMDIQHLRFQLYTQLSGGEKQRVQLARVLAQVWQGDSLLLLDEPTSALDFSHQQQIMNVLKKKTMAGSAVLMVLHDLNLAASYADKIILVDDGRICAMGPPEEVLKTDLLQEVFNIKFHQVTHPTTGKTQFIS
ncbi:MAG: iron complex transport system ATP-binding protein [Pseudohongiellaceae bacterium]|jgi:iron complex transport system ATP-binding protein